MTEILEWAARWNIPMQALAELRVLPQAIYSASGSEADTQAQLRLRMAQKGGHLWRNNSGALQDATGRHVRFGLGNDSARINAKFKSSDLIGITSNGRFIALEVKAPGWRLPQNEREQAQERFIMAVRACGGVASFITDVEQLECLV